MAGTCSLDEVKILCLEASLDSHLIWHTLHQLVPANSGIAQSYDQEKLLRAHNSRAVLFLNTKQYQLWQRVMHKNLPTPQWASQME